MVKSSESKLSRSYPAVAASVPLARTALVAFAEMAGASGELLSSIRLAASEALTNVIVHAYGDRSGLIHVTAVVACGELLLLIADDGCGLGASQGPPGLGLGLKLIADASDQFAIVARSGGGTELQIGFRLGTRSP